MSNDDELTRTTVLGCLWPIPANWVQQSNGDYVGADGILSFTTYDGELVDPRRCEVAAEQRPGDWRLARTANGVSTYGLLSEGGATVAIWVARGEAPAGEEWLYPQVQATYVFAPSAGDLATRIAVALDVRPFHARDYGLLDRFGHATMGPVPVLTSWTSPGDTAAGAVLGAEPDNATLLLVGGGFLTLADEPQCCGVSLAPLSWRSFSAETARSTIRSPLRDADIRFTSASARVWDWTIAKEGCSYEGFDRSDRTRVVGAVWSDQFEQPWHLRYWFGPDHGNRVEQELLRATDAVPEVLTDRGADGS